MYCHSFQLKRFNLNAGPLLLQFTALQICGQKQMSYNYSQSSMEKTYLRILSPTQRLNFLFGHFYQQYNIILVKVFFALLPFFKIHYQVKRSIFWLHLSEQSLNKTGRKTTQDISQAGQIMLFKQSIFSSP